MKKLIVINRQQAVNSKVFEQRKSDQQHQFNQIERMILKLNQSAVEFMKERKYDQAQELLSKAEGALSNMDQNKDPAMKSSYSIMLRNRLLAITYKNIGLSFKEQQHYLQALKFLRQSLTSISLYITSKEENNLLNQKYVASFQENEEQQLQMQALSSITEILIYLGKYDQALKHCEEQLINIEKSSNIQLQSMSLTSLTKIKDSYALKILASTYSSKAYCQEKLNQLNESQKSIEIALSFSKIVNDQRLINDFTNFQANLNFRVQKLRTPDIPKDEQHFTSLNQPANLSVQKDSYKMAKRVFRSKRGKGPKQGHLKINSNEGSISQNPTSRLFSPASKNSDHSFINQFQSADQEAQQNNYLYISNPMRQVQHHRIATSQNNTKRQFKAAFVVNSNNQSNFYLPNVEGNVNQENLKHQPERETFNIQNYIARKQQSQVYSPQIDFTSSSKMNESQQHNRVQSYSKRLENFTNNFIKPFQQQDTFSQYGEYSNDFDDSKRFFKKRIPQQLNDSSFTYNDGLIEAAKIYQSKEQSNRFRVKKTAISSNRTQALEMIDQSYKNTPRKLLSSNLSPDNKSKETSFRVSNNIKSPYLSKDDVQQFMNKRKESSNNSVLRKVLPLKLDDSFRFNNQKSEIIEETARSYLSSQPNAKQSKTPRQVPSGNDSKTHRSFISQEDGIIVEDRMNKIADAIDKLNTQLQKFQDDLQQRQKDPLIIGKQMTSSSFCEISQLEEPASYRTEADGISDLTLQ